MILEGQSLIARIGEDERKLFGPLQVRVQPGELGVVVGPNGSGKSTLLRSLAGLAPPSAGTVILDGKPVLDHRPRDRARRLAYLPQHTPLHHDLPAADLVMLGRMPHLHRLRPPSSADWHMVDVALAEVELTDFRDRRVATLSGGERQRLMLARMLATGAEVLLLDEPTAALDIGHAIRFLQHCRTLASEGKAILLALHDLVLAHRFADHAVVLGVDGEPKALSGPTPEVLTPEVLQRTFGVPFTLHQDGNLAVHIAPPLA